MRVAFVSPYNDRAYGLRSIAAYLRQKGHEVCLICFKQFDSVVLPEADRDNWRRILSMTYPPVMDVREDGYVPCPYIQPSTDHEWDLLIEKLASVRPDLIGINVATATYDIAVRMTDRIHRDLPGVPVIWGGPHPTICPEESLRSADLVAISEGEETAAELCADPERADILGLWRRANGAIVKNPLRPLEQDLDRLPFPSFGEDEWLIEWNQRIALPKANKAYFRGVYSIMSQRGCPFQCTYCIHHAMREMHPGERYFRRRSVENVVAECEQRAKEFELSGICFFDDVFVINAAWIEEFAEKFPKRVGLPFGGFSYPVVSTEDMFRRLAAAGMIFTGIGIQTGSDYIGHEIYGRQYSSEKILELAWMAHKHGIPLLYELLTSCPYEREADLLETLKFLLRMPRPLDMKIKKLVVFPKMKIGTIDKPKPNLPESTFDFYAQLSLMSRHQLIAPEKVLAFASDEYLKANPKILQALAYGLWQAVEQGKKKEDELKELAAAANDASVRGFFGYAKRLVMNRLPIPIAEGLRAFKRKLFGVHTSVWRLKKHTEV